MPSQQNNPGSTSPAEVPDNAGKVSHRQQQTCHAAPLSAVPCPNGT